MKNNDLVSVIIPVFNVYPYLIEALDSVIHQTYDKLEIIIIDDGSTDGSGEICDEYSRQSHNIKVIHQENKGLSAARNVGLDMAHGEFIAFLDSDDKYHPDFVLFMKTVLDRENVDIAICRYTVHRTVGSMLQSDGDLSIPSIKCGSYNRISSLQALADGTMNPNVWNKLYRSKLWENVRFPEGHVYEDIDTMYRVMNLCERIYLIDERLYMRRIRPGSITGSKTQKYISDRILAESHFTLFIKAHSPEIYTSMHLNKRKTVKLKVLISSYLWACRYYWNQENTFRLKLREQIIEIGDAVEVYQLDTHTKICFWMIRFCPFLIRTLYPIYSAVCSRRIESEEYD